MQFQHVEKLLIRVFVLSFVLPILAFGGFAWLSYRDHQAVAGNQVTDRAELVREHATKIFEVQELAAQVVLDILDPLSDQGIRENEQAINLQLQGLTRRFNQIQDVVVIDRNGRLLVTAATFPAPPQVDVTDRTYFRQFKDAPSDQAYITEVLLNRLLAKPTLQLAKMRLHFPAPF
mgnify:CR=1 FL=1